MDISVIIPVYNGADTIAETLHSILAQTLDPTQAQVEILVVNDGSTDQTSTLVQNVMGQLPGQDKTYDIKLIELDNGGVSRARNQGARLAKGRYLTFMDADDLWTTDKLEAQFLALESNPEAGFVYSWVNSIDLDGNFFRRGGYFTMTGDPWVQSIVIDVVESGSNVMIRRQAFEQVQGFDERLTHSEDWDLWIRLAENFSVVTVPMPQILYRQGGVTASTNVRKMEEGSLALIRRIAGQLGRQNHTLIHQSLANRYKILTFEAMDGEAKRERAILAFIYSLKATFYDRQLLLKNFNLLVRFWLKCLVILFGFKRLLRARIFHQPGWDSLEMLFLVSINVHV